MVIYHDTLFVAGVFSETIGSPGNSIASWDGQSWHSLRSGLLPKMTGVSDMKVIGAKLYVSGTFFIMDGINLGVSNGRGLVTWNGNEWCSLGTLANSPIVNLGNWRDELYVMGNFYVINDDSIKHLAHWIGEDYTETCSSEPVSIDGLVLKKTDVLIYPNPTTDQIALKLDYKDISTLQLFSIEGRVLRTIRPTENTVTLSLKNLPDGLYYLKALTSQSFITKRILISRLE